MGLISFLKGGNNRRQIEKLERIVDKIEELEPRFEAYSDEQLREMTAEFKRRLNENYETLDDILPEAFAVCRRKRSGKESLGYASFPSAAYGRYRSSSGTYSGDAYRRR